MGAIGDRALQLKGRGRLPRRGGPRGRRSLDGPQWVEAPAQEAQACLQFSRAQQKGGLATGEGLESDSKSTFGEGWDQEDWMGRRPGAVPLRVPPGPLVRWYGLGGWEVQERTS